MTPSPPHPAPNPSTENNTFKYMMQYLIKSVQKRSTYTAFTLPSPQQVLHRTDIFLTFLLKRLHTFYKHIVAVKATIVEQSPHSKSLLKSGFFFISKRALLVLFLLGQREPS